MLLRRIHIVLAIIELEIDDLINLLPILFPQIIESVEEIRIVEQLYIVVFGRDKVDVISSLILIEAEIVRMVHQFDMGCYVWLVPVGYDFVGR